MEIAYAFDCFSYGFWFGPMPLGTLLVQGQKEVGWEPEVVGRRPGLAEKSWPAKSFWKH
jgi:hypothetical protein